VGGYIVFIGDLTGILQEGQGRLESFTTVFLPFEMEFIATHAVQHAFLY
jgi:hypothetical protein